MDDLSLFLDEDSGDVTFCYNEMSVFSVNLIILTLSKFDKIDPNTIILTGLLA